MAGGRSRPVTFFLLAICLISGPALLPLLAVPVELHAAVPWLLPLGAVAACGPSLAGLAAAAREGGAAAVRDLLRRAVPRARDARWLAVAALAPLAAAGTAAWLALRSGMPPGPGDPDRLARFAPLLLRALLLAGLGQELGWRGFALPRLQARLGPLGASLVLGAVHAAWLWPFLRAHGSDALARPFAPAAGGVVAMSFALTWIHNRTGGSLAACALLHASAAATVETLRQALPVFWIGGGMASALAVTSAAGALALVAVTNGRLGAAVPSR
jgi:membrane protease YdiL (CAAX protease family)